MRYLILLILSICFLSCGYHSNSDGTIAYFSGVIDNPQSDLVYLKDSNGKFDTIYIDEDNRFHYKIKDLVPGIYEFRHGYEIQVVVLEPNDSIALKLNTKDFDESLAYSGKGSKKNNLLIKLFLRHEKHKENIYKSWKTLEPEKFEILIDSILEKEKRVVNEFNSDKNSSDLFTYISNSIVDFSYYYFKENYPFYYYGEDNLIHFKDLPEGFYNYRSSLNLSDDKFTELYAYRQYIFAYVNNFSLYEYYKDEDHKRKFNEESVAYNIEKLRLIDSLFSNQDIKNYLLRSVTREYMMRTRNTSHMKEITNAYLEICDNDREKDKMQDFMNSRINVKSGNKLPELSLYNSQNDKIALHNLIDKPSVIYFWATNHDLHARNSYKFAEELQSNHPEVNFIGINLVEYNPEFWNKSLNDYRFKKDNQYMFVDYAAGPMKLAADLNHIILVDRDGYIDNTNLHLFSNKAKLEMALERLISAPKVVKN